MFPLAFVAGWLQGHWWGFFSRNYVVWPTFLLKNVFIALKGSHFWFLFKLFNSASFFISICVLATRILKLLLCKHVNVLYALSKCLILVHVIFLFIYFFFFVCVCVCVCVCVLLLFFNWDRTWLLTCVLWHCFISNFCFIYLLISSVCNYYGIVWLWLLLLYICI